MDRSRCGPPSKEGDIEACSEIGRRLVELKRKYDLLVALRREPAGRTAARRDAMRTVATCFPGALREWDGLPIEELVRRQGVVVTALRQQTQGVTPPVLADKREAWLGFALDLHAHLRALLRLRRWLRQCGPVDDAVVSQSQQIYDQADPAWPEQLSPRRLAQIAQPPEGRLAELAYRDIAARHGVSAQEVKRALFCSQTRPGSAPG
ncbi:MAG: hypothetical protein RMK29_02285 [Myxococcales bacterium]|nr:hypothetical protein [Myxococcota bacterium]MDW8280509.1 hypothetical protein [Myxococcales bacterium]